jgi:hypothetical protein
VGEVLVEGTDNFVEHSRVTGCDPSDFGDVLENPAAFLDSVFYCWNYCFCKKEKLAAQF